MPDSSLSGLPFEQLPSTASPFESGSRLGSSGYLITIDDANVEQFLASRVVEYCSHVELARDGQVHFAAYDTFDSVCFWECISPGMLKAMTQEGLILDYRLTHA